MTPEQTSNLVFLIPLLPGISAALLGLTWMFGVRLHKTTVKVLACGSVFISFLLSIGSTLALLKLPEGARHYSQTLWTWFSTFGVAEMERLNVPFAFEIDPLSAVMILVVTGIGFLIHVYSTAYMADDEGFQKFFSYLNLFMFSMLILVLGNNFLMMFIGWEGVGLCSYLLIGFWYKELPNAKAAKKAFVVNRVGDFMFIVGLMALFWLVGQETGFYSITFSEMREKQELYLLAQNSVSVLGLPVITFATLMFFGGATGKSAQIPLYVWLPDAMAGPTPVSALIHAATMVTSGLYMITRLNFLFALAPETLLVIGIIGAATAVMAASIGLFQYDIKKVLAYSTVSQLGYMFLAMGAGAWAAGMFHVFTHAFFKALMFLGAGSVIHSLHHALPHGVDAQDMRNMGGMRKYMPATFLTFLAGWLAICGIFPFAGFWSKDEILWKSLEHGMGGQTVWYVLYGAGLIGAAMTAFYMTRQVWMVFFGEYRGKKIGEEYLAKHGSGHGHGDDHGHEDDHGHGHLHDPHESPFAITGPLTVLAIGSVFVGLIGVGAWATHLTGYKNVWNEWLSPVLAEGRAVKTNGTYQLVNAEGSVILPEASGLLAAGAPAEEHATDAAHPAALAAAPAHGEAAGHGEHVDSHAAGHGDTHAAESHGDAHASGGHGEGHAAAGGHGGAHHAPWYVELLFAVISVLVALTSMFTASKLYGGRAERPTAMLAKYGPGGPQANSLAGRAYALVYDKWRVDELYEATAVRGTDALSRFSGAFDKYVVDGLVHLVAYTVLVLRAIAGVIDKYIVDGIAFLGFAKLVNWTGDRFRSLQTGDLQGYLRWVGYGALATVGAYVLLVFQT